MGSQPQAQPQPELLSRASAEQLAELSKVLGDPHLLLEAGLRLAMQVVSAKRGLAFDTAGLMASSPCLNRPLGRPLFQAGQVKSKAVNLTVAPG